MTRWTRWCHLAAIFLPVGIVLLPLRAVAATVPMLITSDAVVTLTAMVRVEMGPSLRPERSSAREYVYDEAHHGYDDGSNSLVLGSEGADHP